LTPGGKNANYVADLTPQVSFYLSSASTGSANNGNLTGGQPNKLTILSGTLLTNLTTIGRDGPGIVVLNGGAWIGTQSLQLGGSDKNSIGTGTYEYHGGNFTQFGSTRIGAANVANSPTKFSASVGKFVVYNDGPDGSIQTLGGFDLSYNSSSVGSIGIAEFHYDLNTHGVGNTRPVNSDGSSLTLRNSARQSSRLNLVLDAAPSITGGNPQNLGLFKESTIVGASTFPRLFYSLDGLTGYTQGAVVTATYGSYAYSWTISYSGVITFTDSANSFYSSANIAAVNGNDVVLIGTSYGLVPEPGSLALLGGVGSLILARRRRSCAR